MCVRAGMLTMPTLSRRCLILRPSPDAHPASPPHGLHHRSCQRRVRAVQGALAEATFMTGLERNGEVVHMASFAPLFTNTNDHWWQTNLIMFNGTACAPAPPLPSSDLCAPSLQ